MPARIRSKLSYANVTATLALFLALGGAGYAALRLPKDSVGTRQLKNGAVTGKKLANGAVSAKKVSGPVPSALTAGARIFSHRTTATLGLTDVATFHTFQSLSLPAGTYLVTAKHVVQTTKPLEVDCDVVRGPSLSTSAALDSFYTELPANGAVPMVGTAVAKLTSPTTITDQCAEYHDTGAILAAGYLTAVKVGPSGP